MEKSEKFKGLIAFREELKGALNKLLNHFDECKKWPEHCIGIINEKRKQIDILNDEITMTLETKSEIIEEIMLQNEYDSFLLEFIIKLERAKEVTPSTQLQLKKFSGNTDEWESFWNTFETIVDKSPDLTNVIKFIYLSSLLEGRALKAIQGYGYTNDGYFLAVKELKRRFAKQPVYKNETDLSTECTKTLEFKECDVKKPIRQFDTDSLSKIIMVENVVSYPQTFTNLSEESFFRDEETNIHIDNEKRSVCRDSESNQEIKSITDEHTETRAGHENHENFELENSTFENLSVEFINIEEFSTDVSDTNGSKFKPLLLLDIADTENRKKDDNVAIEHTE